MHSDLLVILTGIFMVLINSCSVPRPAATLPTATPDNFPEVHTAQILDGLTVGFYTDDGGTYSLKGGDAVTVIECAGDFAHISYAAPGELVSGWMAQANLTEGACNWSKP